MTHRNISIGMRMGIGFGLFLAILALLAGAVFHYQQRASEARAFYAERSRPLAEGAQSLENALLRTGIGVRSYLLSPSPELRQRHEANLAAARAELRHLESLPMEPDGAALFRAAHPLVERYLAEADGIVAERARGGVPSESEVQLARTRESSLAALASFRELKSRKEERMLQELENTADQVNRATLASALAAALIFVVLAWFTTQSIRKPTRTLVRVASAMSSGDWRPALEWLPAVGAPAKPRNEMLRIAQAFGFAALALEKREQRLQAQNEELQAQNEELQAQGEEIQAQNEELQAQSEEIQSQNEQVKEQSDQLRRQAQSLIEADQRKTEFLGLLAHELRNPMAGIANSLHLLNAGAAEYADLARGVIERQTRQLGRLIDDLLDITRISRGKIELQCASVDLVQVVHECIEDNQAAFRKAGVVLDARVDAGPLMVDGDRARIRQVICNLLDNAVKFTDAGRRVALSLQRSGGEARLSIADEGVGIPAEVLERLFTPFIQGDPSLARRQGGLGLGLALVKALVEMHGGSVEARSAGPGTGATFEIGLPLASSDETAEPRMEADRSPESDAAPCRVLIIEDNTDAAESLRAALALKGHEVLVACSGLEGLEAALRFKPDVLLCDIGLPVIDGYEVARRFRADQRLRTVRLVAVTGYAAAQDCARARQAGFDDHFPKPPDMERLSELLARIAISRASASSREASA